MALTSRAYASVDDLREIQAALTAAWLTPRRPLIPSTIGDVAWWLASGGPDADWPARIRIWTDGGRTVAWGWISLPNGLDWFVAPGLDESDERRVREEILTWASERAIALSSTPENPKPLEAWAADGWPEQDVLARLGYGATDDGLTQYFQSLERELPGRDVAPGYTLRNLTGPEDIPARVEVHRSAFAPSKMTTEKYGILVDLPGYRYDLDAVAVAPDGSFAAFTMCWLDPAAELGYFEPVGTHQMHRRLGLAKAVNAFGLRRLRDEGARDAMVFAELGNEASNGLYQSVGFRQVAVHRKYAAPALQSNR
ncbi:MAG TPA: GNAT family N-acetyltransferase [Candidatus Limnocylindrales bacterium]|nr:GNAT family N-acetyltransferase [Candidatus Limnocylindrales bacterium]